MPSRVDLCDSSFVYPLVSELTATPRRAVARRRSAARSHQGTSNNQIATPQKATNQKAASQNSTSSRFIVGCRLMLIWPAMRGGADALPELLQPVLLLRANDLGFAATSKSAEKAVKAFARAERGKATS